MDVSLDKYGSSGTAIATLNSEYATLFDLLQRLMDCFGNNVVNHDAEICAKASALIDSLYERAQHLFSSEETMIRETDHPQLPKYLREHRIRIAELQLLIKQMKADIQCFDGQPIKTFRTWLVENQAYSRQAISRAIESH